MALKGHVALDRTSWSLESVWNRVLWNTYSCRGPMVQKIFKSTCRMIHSKVSLIIAWFSFYLLNYAVDHFVESKFFSHKMADHVSSRHIMKMFVWIVIYILLQNYLSNHLHFITNHFKRFSKTTSTNPRQRVPLIIHWFHNQNEIKWKWKCSVFGIPLNNTLEGKGECIEMWFLRIFVLI